MPIYVYACMDNKDHSRKEAEHKIPDGTEPDYHCEECGAIMERVPQPLRYAGIKPDAADMHVKYLDYNHKRHKKGLPRWSPYKVKRPPE